MRKLESGRAGPPPLSSLSGPKDSSDGALGVVTVASQVFQVGETEAQV